MERKTKTKPAASRQKILDDHRTIGQLSSEIASAADCKKVAACVQSLLPVLKRHFAEEEEEIAGLHAVIRTRTPEMQNALHGLTQEHAQLLARAEQLLAAATQATVLDAGMQQRGKQLREQLAAHEANETRVFMESIWTDFGEGD